MSDPTDLDRLINERLDALLPKKLAELREKQTPSMTIIATKGTLDWAYPPFILASTAAALGWNVSMFFTFYGLSLLRKDISDLKISPLGNPGMPMKMPFGPEWFKGINWNIPNVVQGIVPGFETLRHHAHEADDPQQGRGRHRRAAHRVHRGRREPDRLPDDGGPVRLHAARISSPK